MLRIIVRLAPQVEPDKRAAVLSCDAPLLQPVHSQYTKRPLSALNHSDPSRTLLEQYQRFTLLSTTISDPDNDLIIRRSSVQARPAPLGVSAVQGPEARPRRTVPDTPDVAHLSVHSVTRSLVTERAVSGQHCCSFLVRALSAQFWPLSVEEWVASSAPTSHAEATESGGTGRLGSCQLRFEASSRSRFSLLAA